MVSDCSVPGQELFAESLLAQRLLEQARTARQRRVLVLSGEKAWCHEHAQKLVDESKTRSVVWVSDVDLPATEIVAGNKVKTLLGQERDVVVFDAHAGFDPDAFGAVSGIINGGGLLLLLCPPLEEWEKFPDPASERIASWPCTPQDISGRFIRRLINILRESGGVVLVEEHKVLPVLDVMGGAVVDAPSAESFTDEIFRTSDQQAAVEAIEYMVRGDRHLPVVLVSDRGRGKSAALGIAAARLMQAQQALRIVVTAPRPDAVESLFAQAQALLPDATRVSNGLEFKNSTLEFHAPDELCLAPVEADLLLVDEAAAIPASLLQQLLNQYSRIVFATTVHGYEGTGRGFAVRFRNTLDTQTPGWREVLLHTPIRWAENDPLEAFIFRALLLDAESAADQSVQTASVENVCVEILNRDALADDEATLSALFGLLVVAHYRTTPNDLRNLLDGPGLSVYVMRFKGSIVATALISTEGPFDQDMASAIYAGRRRPRGHLIPQSLTTHAGIKAAADLRCARIMRIAVHPAAQRRGLGKALLAHIRNEASAQGVDVIGASFGATAGLLHFWEQANMQPVRVGFRRDHASGEHSVMVLEPLSAKGDAVFQLARNRLHRDLPHWLADPLRDLDSQLAQSLLAGQPSVETSAMNPHDRDMLQAFAQGQRSYEDSLGPLWRLCHARFKAGQARLSSLEVRIVDTKLLEKQSWSEVAEHCELNGRAEVLRVLRSAVGILLSDAEE